MLFAAGRFWKQVREGVVAETPQTVPLICLSAAWLGTVLALDLSGIVRGEVARIWLFLAPAGLTLAGPTTPRKADPSQEPGRQTITQRVRMNVGYTAFAGLQLLQAIVLQREAVFVRFW
jgi:hypothetical protein